ncbi:hypothetical protein AYO38_11565 [bacterium SCGC AG-212-C10]|nr:hypothetical protein AYO38_11565 [bacterium SCGC AG-212-C10]
MDQAEIDLIARVRELSRDKFVERAAGYDREGAFARENVDDLKALGVTAMVLPKESGGLAISPEAQVRIIEEVAYGDGSTAVALNMHLLAADLLNFLPPFPRRNLVIEDVGRNGALMCGPASVPSTEVDDRRAGFQLTEDGDDLVINGKAGFASMSEGATYTIIGGRIETDGVANICLTLPRMDTPGLTLLRNWDAMGLRGTASNDVVAENVRIPRADALIIPAEMFMAFLNAQASILTPQIQMRSKGALGIAAIWLGLAQAAMDFTLNYVQERHGYLASATLATGNTPGFRSDQAWAQFGIGNMDHWLETGRTILYDTTRSLESRTFASPQEFTRHIVRTIYHLRRMGEEVAEGSMKVCGAHAYVKNRPLERIFRDMVGGNVMAWKTDELQQTLGVGALGRSITFTGPAGM